MEKITYEDKMGYLEQLRQKQRKSFKVDLIECIMEDVVQMHQLEEQCQKRQNKEIADIYEELFLK